jgi:hypothetical protein
MSQTFHVISLAIHLLLWDIKIPQMLPGQLLIMYKCSFLVAFSFFIMLWAISVFLASELCTVNLEKVPYHKFAVRVVAGHVQYTPNKIKYQGI